MHPFSREHQMALQSTGATRRMIGAKYYLSQNCDLRPDDEQGVSLAQCPSASPCFNPYHNLHLILRTASVEWSDWSIRVSAWASWYVISEIFNAVQQ